MYADIQGVIDLITEIISRDSPRGIEMGRDNGLPVYTELTRNGRVSVTWSLLDEDRGRPVGVFLREISDFDLDPLA